MDIMVRKSTGWVSKHLVKQALEESYEMAEFACNTSKISLSRPNFFLDWTNVRPGAFTVSEFTGQHRHGFSTNDKSVLHKHPDCLTD